MISDEITHSSSTELSVALWQQECQASIISDSTTSDSVTSPSSSPKKISRVRSSCSSGNWSAFILEEESSETHEVRQADTYEQGSPSKTTGLFTFFKKIKPKIKRASSGDGSFLEGLKAEHSHDVDSNVSIGSSRSHEAFRSDMTVTSERSADLDILFSNALVHAKQKEKQNIRERVKEKADEIILEARQKHERRKQRQQS